MTPDAGGGGATRSQPLAILACAGPLPIEVAKAATRAGRPVFIVGIDGFADRALEQFPSRIVNIGQVGRMIAAWRAAGCTELVIAGAMRRPNLWRIKIDGGFFRAAGTVMSLTRGGDDSILRRIIGFFEREGFRVVGPHHVAPHLLAPAGPLGRIKPDPPQAAAITRAGVAIDALGRFDIGQAVVANADHVIAVEGVRGTDAMLRDVEAFAASRSGAVLVKLPKPGQETRIDLPAIGPETVRRAAAAGLSGIAIAAGSALVLERDEVCALAEASGLFVVGITRDEASTQADVTIEQVAPRLLGGPKPRARELADIALGHRVLGALTAIGAGCGVVVAGEHVLAIDADLPLAHVVRSLGRGNHWGLRVVRRNIGVLVTSGIWECPVHEMAAILDAARAAGLAGIALVGDATSMAQEAIVAAATARGLFVVAVPAAGLSRSSGGAHA